MCMYIYNMYMYMYVHIYNMYIYTYIYIMLIQGLPRLSNSRGRVE